MANSSPDPVLFATEMWKKIALPAIFYGCEVLPIRKAELTHVDAVAAGVGKYILQLNKSAANVEPDSGLWGVKKAHRSGSTSLVFRVRGGAEGQFEDPAEEEGEETWGSARPACPCLRYRVNS